MDKQIIEKIDTRQKLELKDWTVYCRLAEHSHLPAISVVQYKRLKRRSESQQIDRLRGRQAEMTDTQINRKGYKHCQQKFTVLIPQ